MIRGEMVDEIEVGIESNSIGLMMKSFLRLGRMME